MPNALPLHFCSHPPPSQITWTLKIVQESKIACQSTATGDSDTLRPPFKYWIPFWYSLLTPSVLSHYHATWLHDVQATIDTTFSPVRSFHSFGSSGALSSSPKRGFTADCRLQVAGKPSQLQSRHRHTVCTFCTGFHQYIKVKHCLVVLMLTQCWTEF